MTVPENPNTRTEAVGNGITVSFPFDFLCLESRDLRVSVSGVELSPSQYTVGGLGQMQGGTVTFYSPPAAGTPILMELDVVVARAIDYQDYGDLFAATVNFDFDRLWLAIKGVFTSLRRALILGPYDVDGQGAYRANNNRITGLGDPEADTDAVNRRYMFAFVTDYVDRAIAGVIGGFGWFLQAGVGAIFRTFQDKMRDSVSVKDFGAIGDGAYHPLSERFTSLPAAQAQYPFVTGLDQSIDWAAIQAAINTRRPAYAPQGRYVLTDDLNVWRGCEIYGDGVDRWDTVFQSDGNWTKEDGHGTHLYFYGTGEKKYTLDRVSACRATGGVRVINGLSYELLDFTNGDAIAGGTATPRQFSAAVVVHQGGKVRRLRVLPWFDGLNGYNTRATTDLSNAVWDIGIYPLTSWDFLIEDVQAVGHWRMAAALPNSASDGGPLYPNGERGRWVRCLLQGMRGLAIRGGDVTKVISHTATTLTVPWDRSFVWGGGRSFIAAGSEGSVTVTPTGQSYDAVAGTVTFTSNVPLPGTLFELRPYMSNGLSFSDFIDCYCTGLEHASGQRADQLGLGVSSPIECSGFGVRQPMARATKFQTHEAAAGIFHNCGDVRLTDCQFEGQNSSVTYLLATPFDSGSLVVTPYQRGHTDGMRMPGTVISPSVNITEFKPRGCWWDVGAIPSQTMNSSDNQQLMRNWRSGPFRLQDDAGLNFLEIPASTAAQRDVDINREGVSYRIRATSTDFLLQTKVGFMTFTNSTGTALLKLLAGSGRAEFLGSPVPVTDNSVALGASANRWSQLFAASGTINTSDRSEKTEPLPIDDAVLDAWSDVKIVVFQWLHAIEAKGDDARWHFGVIAQQVRDAFLARGIDGCRYGVLCYDEWEDAYEPVIGVRTVRHMMEYGDGVLVPVDVEEEYDTGTERLVRAAGSRWGIRPDQCFFLEAAYQRRRAERADAVIANLTSRIEALEARP